MPKTVRTDPGAMTTGPDASAPLRFDGQVALVTGVSSGLGRGYALGLARRGATVIGSVRPGSKFAEATAELGRVAAAEGLTLELISADSTVEAETTRLVSDAIERHGRLDVLVNNAGSNWPGPIHDGSTEQLRAMIDIALMGTFWTMLPALAHMRERGSGRIVNTVSGAAMFGSPRSFAYSASKGAVQSMSRAAALDNDGLDICINMISPIAVTAMSPGYQAIHPDLDDDRMSVDRIVPVLVYLAHPTCLLNGQTLHAAAGRVALLGSFVTQGWGSDSLTAEDVAGRIDAICDRTDVVPLTGRLEQYGLIPKRAADFTRWR